MHRRVVRRRDAAHPGAVCRFLLGIGEAGNWPAGVKAVAEWFPERERAWVICRAAGFPLKRGYAVTDARKASATFFAALMPSAIPAVLVSDVRLSIGLISIAMAGYEVKHALACSKQTS